MASVNWKNIGSIDQGMYLSASGASKEELPIQIFLDSTPQNYNEIKIEAKDRNLLKTIISEYKQDLQKSMYANIFTDFIECKNKINSFNLEIIDNLTDEEYNNTFRILTGLDPKDYVIRLQQGVKPKDLQGGLRLTKEQEAQLSRIADEYKFGNQRVESVKMTVLEGFEERLQRTKAKRDQMFKNVPFHIEIPDISSKLVSCKKEIDKQIKKQEAQYEELVDATKSEDRNKFYIQYKEITGQDFSVDTYKELVQATKERQEHFSSETYMKYAEAYEKMYGKNIVVENLQVFENFQSDKFNRTVGGITALPYYAMDKSVEYYNNHRKKINDAAINTVKFGYQVYKVSPDFAKSYEKEAVGFVLSKLASNDTVREGCKKVFEKVEIPEDKKDAIVNYAKENLTKDKLTSDTCIRYVQEAHGLYNAQIQNLYKRKSDIDISNLSIEDAANVKYAYTATCNATKGEAVNSNYVKDNLTHKNENNGYEVFVQRADKDKKIIISYRDTNDAKDIKSDCQLAKNQKPEQLEDAIKTYKDILSKYPDYEIIITGHSLGGSLTEMVCSSPEAKKHGKTKGFVFNSYGCSNVLAQCGNSYQDIKNVISIRANEDFVGAAAPHVGRDYVYKKTDSADKLLDSIQDTYNKFNSGESIAECKLDFINNAKKLVITHKLFEMDSIIMALPG